ncbi:MAG TPA: ankyrin repeat domain-containing protein, partial [Burkholderiaceae bacterium]
LGHPQTSEAEPSAGDSAASTRTGSAAPHPLAGLGRPPKATASGATPPRPRTAMDGTSPRVEAEALDAIGRNRPGELHKLIQLQPALLTSRLKTGQTLLTHAIEAGSLDSVRVVIETARLKEAEGSQRISLKSVVDMPDSEGRTPLAHAARLAKPQIAEMLLYADPGKSIPLADVNLIDHAGFTALNHAVRSRYDHASDAGQAVALAILRRPDAIPDLAGNNTARPMEGAIELGLREVVRAIVNHPNTDPNAPNAQGKPPLWQAIAQWESHPNIFGNALQWEKIVCDMMSNPRIAHTANEQGRPPLVQLCHCPYPEVLRKTLHAVLRASRANPNLDLNAADETRSTALHVLQRQAEQYQEYAPIAAMLGNEALPRELAQMRNAMSPLAQAFIPKLKQAERAAAAGRIEEFNRLAGDIMDEVEEANDNDEIQGGDYLLIMNQLGKTHRFAGMQSDQASSSSAPRPAPSPLDLRFAGMFSAANW